MKYVERRVPTPSGGQTYPVQDCRPALHRDALKDGQHGEPNIIEAGNTEVGSFPLLDARAVAAVADVRTGRCYRVVICIARRREFALLHDLSCMEWSGVQKVVTGAGVQRFARHYSAIARVLTDIL